MRSLDAAEAARIEFTIEIPHCQPVVRQLQFWVVEGFVAERVDVSADVSTNPIGIDEFVDERFFFQLLFFFLWAEWIEPVVRGPAIRLQWNLERSKDLVVEISFALEEVFEILQKLPGLRLLGCAMVIGARYSHNPC